MLPNHFMLNVSFFFTIIPFCVMFNVSILDFIYFSKKQVKSMSVDDCNMVLCQANTLPTAYLPFETN